MFEYLGLLVDYDPRSGTYRVLDIAYEVALGIVSVSDGPGAIIDLTTTFLDAGNAHSLAEFLSDVNSTL